MISVSLADATGYSGEDDVSPRGIAAKRLRSRSPAEQFLSQP